MLYATDVGSFELGAAAEDGAPVLRLTSVLPGINIEADILAHCGDDPAARATLLNRRAPAEIPVAPPPIVTGRGFALSLQAGGGGVGLNGGGGSSPAAPLAGTQWPCLPAAAAADTG